MNQHTIARVCCAALFLLVPVVIWSTEHKEDSAIAEHRFHLGMASADLEKSLGRPQFKQADGNSELWVYPSVAIKVNGGRVMDSVKIPQ